MDLNAHKKSCCDLNNIDTKSNERKPEMVFFPYKASMWDSLESIWQAAMVDGRYKCRVIPIPYYDKKSDGSLGAMHYEGDQYPDYVPVENWQEYDVNANRPAVAFIHNPYDEINTVTSVHPDYYAEVLRHKVEKLVYCPYFLSTNVVDRLFCITPAVGYADYVFLQSEHIRKQYLEYWDKYEKENNINGGLGNFREKLIALGSPKIDKIRAFDKKQCIIPMEWRKLIGERKVVLYNTHLDDIMSYKGEFIKKLLWVFSYFRNNKEYVLWWRPHPLMEQTIENMFPEYLQIYRKIVGLYKNEGFGIYDDTADVHRAIGFADIYYGSGSSLVPLFGMTRKPIIMQNISCNSRGADGMPERKLEYLFCVRYQNMYYVGIKDANLIISRPIDQEQWSIEAELPVDFICIDSSYCKVVQEGGKLYILSIASYMLLEYDIETKAVNVINLGINEDENIQEHIAWYGTPSVSDLIKHNGDVIITPFKVGAIAMYNLATGAVVYYNEWQKQFMSQLDSDGNRFYNFRAHSACVVDEKLYMTAACSKEDVICCIDLENMQLTQVYRPKEKGNLFYMEPVESGIWMQWIDGDNSSLLLWSIENGVMNEIDISSCLSGSDKRVRLTATEDKISTSPINGQIFTWEYVGSDEQGLGIQEYIGEEKINQCIRRSCQNILQLYEMEIKESGAMALPNILSAIENMDTDTVIKEDSKYSQFFHLEDESAGSLIYKKIVELTSMDK